MDQEESCGGEVIPGPLVLCDKRKTFTLRFPSFVAESAEWTEL